MKFTITPGHARFTSADVRRVIEHDDVKIFEIDMNTKYCDVYTMISRDVIDVVIVKNDDTLDGDPTTDANTIITFNLPDVTHAWTAITTSRTRYTVRVVLYRYPVGD